MKGYFLSDIDLEEETLDLQGLALKTPVLSPEKLAEISDRLIDAQKTLAEQSIFKIVDWIDSAARLWLDPNDSIRQEAESLLPVVGGDSKEMVHLALEDLFKNLTRPVLLQLLEEELGDITLLDHFRPKLKGAGFTRAFGPRLTAHILPGNIPGVSVISLVCGLLAKSANLAKVSAEEILLPVLFARSLQKSRPELARALAILYWDPASSEITEAAFQKAELAVVYGSDPTIEQVRKMIPSRLRALFHGNRLSLGIVARESVGPEIAEAAALDVALYDQRGCLSPHLYYIEEGGAASPLEFAQWVAQALYTLSFRLPKGRTSQEEAAQIQQLRGALPLKGGKVFPSPAGVDWTVLYDPDPSFALSPLARTVWIKPVSHLSEIPPRLEAVRPFLQAAGIAIPMERRSEMVLSLAKMGIGRFCPIGKMQKPPMTWRHDGRFRLLDFLRFVDLENP